MNLPAQGAPRKKGQINDCADCGTPIYRYQLRCKPCNAVASRSSTMIPCAHCGTPKPVTRGEAATYARHFCNKACKSAYDTAHRPSAPCQECGALVRRAPSRLEGRKRVFCSGACRVLHLQRTKHHVENVASTRVSVVCAHCGTVVLRKPSQAALAERYFCSRDCSAAAQKGRKAKRRGASRPCAHCGVAVYRPKCRDRAPGRKYCSRACAWAARRKPEIHLTRTCAACSADYATTLHQLIKRNSRYCSRACMDVGMRTGTTPYNFYWRKIAKIARRRDRYTCQLCGVVQKAPRLHVHHIVPAATFGVEQAQEANDLRNLTSLCARCHRKAESNPALLADSEAWQLALPLCG